MEGSLWNAPVLICLLAVVCVDCVGFGSGGLLSAFCELSGGSWLCLIKENRASVAL